MLTNRSFSFKIAQCSKRCHCLSQILTRLLVVFATHSSLWFLLFSFSRLTLKSSSSSSFRFQIFLRLHDCRVRYEFHTSTNESSKSHTLSISRIFESWNLINMRTLKTSYLIYGKLNRISSWHLWHADWKIQIKDFETKMNIMIIFK